MNTLKIGERKVQQKGLGLCVMLPSIWVKNLGLLKGDRVNITMKNEMLIIEVGAK